MLRAFEFWLAFKSGVRAAARLFRSAAAPSAFAAPSPPTMEIPAKWKRFFVGRVIAHPERAGERGVVKWAAVTRLGQTDPAVIERNGAPISARFAVHWADGSVTELEDFEVEAAATQEFAYEEWVLPKIRALQQVRRGGKRGGAPRVGRGAARPLAAPLAARRRRERRY